MSHLINPKFLRDYTDDIDSISTNGCYQGSDYWEAERLADRALERDRRKRQRQQSMKRELENLKNDLLKAEDRGYRRKAENLKKEIECIEDELKSY